MTLSLENLTVARGHQILIRDLNLAIMPGETVLLTGVNGSGKTTLLHVIAGLLRPARGAVHYPAAFHWLGTDNALKGDLTVRENLNFFCENEAAHALQKFYMDAHIDTLIRHLSNGQKRRVALSRLFLQPRALWLLDEPALGLDDAGVELLSQHIKDHNETGGLAIIATHDLGSFTAHRHLDFSTVKIPVAA